MADRTRRTRLLLLTLALVVPPAAAQSRWQTYLYSGRVNCLATRGEDIWAGTSAGLELHRQTGLGTIAAPPGPTLQAARSVSAVLLQGPLAWLGTTAGTVIRLDLETNASQVFDERTGFPAAPVTGLATDGQDVWAATDGGGMARFNPLKQEWQVWSTADGLPTDRCLAVAGDDEGLWIGTYGGLVRYDRLTLQWRAVPLHDALRGAVRSLVRSAANLWIVGEPDVLARIKLATGEFLIYDLKRFGVTHLGGVTLGPGGDLWLASDRGLLMAPREDLTGEAWPFIERELGLVTAVVEVGRSVWVGSADKGLWRYDLDAGQWQAQTPAQIFPSGDITAVAAQAGYTWLGFAADGLVRYDARTETWEALRPPDDSPRQVVDVAAHDQWLYGACRDGIVYYDQRAKLWKSVVSRFNTQLLGDDWTTVLVASGHVWFAGTGRVAVFTPDMKHVATYRFPTAQGDRQGTLPKLVTDEATGDIWLICRDNAWRYQPRQNVWGQFGAELFQPVTAGEHLADDRSIRAVAFDNDSAWFVTRDQVLQYSKQLNQCAYWHNGLLAGLTDPRLIASDRLALWLATGEGILKLDRPSGGWSLQRWPELGLTGPPTALAVDSAEPYVWVATNRQVARLNLAAAEPSWQVFPPATGLVPGVRRIVPTPYAVWFVGDEGVSVYRRDVAWRAP